MARLSFIDKLTDERQSRLQHRCRETGAIIDPKEWYREQVVKNIDTGKIVHWHMKLGQWMDLGRLVRGRYPGHQVGAWENPDFIAAWRNGECKDLEERFPKAFESIIKYRKKKGLD